MAYDKTGLQPIGGQAKAGNAPQMWSYTSTDAKCIADMMQKDISMMPLMY